MPEPLPVELHNTVYADRGVHVDLLADEAGLRGWLEAQRERLPADADPRRREEFAALREAVRAALQAVVDGAPVPADAAAALNRASLASPSALVLESGAAEVRFAAADPTDIVLGVLAAETIGLVAGPDAARLRVCGRPACVLMFLKDHPRREWCSNVCGNRARQARHYARTHGTMAS